MEKVIVIGSGFAGMSAACFLAKEGYEVTILEKHDRPGGRARSFSTNGFSFDMGPSWYWMPDVFERFFAQFNKSVSDYYSLKRLDPSYQVFWQDGKTELPADYEQLKALFEQIEKGAGNALDRFMKEASYKYDAGINTFVHKPGLSVTEFMNMEVAKSVFKIDLFGNMHKHVRSYFSDPKLLQLTEFPILFLGALPENTPALYSLMNYADMKLGTWYPMGGMVQIVNAMYSLALSLGVQFKFNEDVQHINVIGSHANKVETINNTYHADIVVAACDYHHCETKLLDKQYSNYSDKYWEGRSMAPSSLLYYIGVDKKVDGLLHHNLFFDAPFNKHAAELYTKPQWPEDPLMYVCAPSKTDDSVAPEGCENLFALIPVAPGLEDNDEIQERYYNKVINKIEQHTNQSISDNVVYKRSFAYRDFVSDYNSFKGNAYGLANTLKQTAILKPSIKNKKVKNLFYTGQLTVPGPGVPPSLISGEVVAKQIQRSLKLKTV